MKIALAIMFAMIISLLLSGCAQQVTAPTTTTTPTESVGVKSVDAVSSDIDEVTTFDTELDDSDLDNLEAELDSLDW